MSWTPAPPVTADLKVRPSGWWYLVVVALWLATIGLIASIVVTGARIVDDGVARVPASRVVDVPGDGLTVYASHQTSSRNCTAFRAGREFDLHSLSFDLNVTINGNQVYAVATTPSGFAPGLYRLSCAGIAPGEALWTGDRIPIASMGIRAIVATVCFLVGLVVLIILLIRRSIGKKRVRNARMSAAAGYPLGWGGQPGPGYPPSPYGPSDRWPPEGGGTPS